MARETFWELQREAARVKEDAEQGIIDPTLALAYLGKRGTELVGGVWIGNPILTPYERAAAYLVETGVAAPLGEVMPHVLAEGEKAPESVVVAVEAQQFVGLHPMQMAA